MHPLSHLLLEGSSKRNSRHPKFEPLWSPHRKRLTAAVGTVGALGSHFSVEDLSSRASR